MKCLKLKRRNIFLISSLSIFVLVLTVVSSTFGMQHYYKLDFSTGLVTATTLNVRSGPGTNYKVIAQVKRGDYIRVFAGVGEWYIVQIEGDYVGAVNKDYVKAIYPNTGTTTASGNNSSGGSGAAGSSANSTSTAGLNSNELEVFNLINKQRINNGLQALKIDTEVQRVARIKAQDLVDNNYFSHNSPVYGSPFDMLKSFKITYTTAGENIAGNSSNSGAVEAWMNSPGHRANILNGNYNYTGIGVVTSPKYGKMFVQMFIGKN